MPLAIEESCPLICKIRNKEKESFRDEVTDLRKKGVFVISIDGKRLPIDSNERFQNTMSYFMELPQEKRKKVISLIKSCINNDIDYI